MELINRFKSRAPEYDEQYHDMIMGFTMEQGGRAGTATDTTSWEQGKYFTTRYEIYMYSALLGLKKDYRVEIPKGTEKKKFIEINAWKPVEIVDYIIMGLLAKSDLDFTELEKLSEEEVEKELTKLKSILEEYANGGFDIIRAKKEADPDFFVANDNCFLDLLDET
jgi:hypothetical protein